MPDYINHIARSSARPTSTSACPHSGHLQHFICRNIPTPDESFVIIHFRKGAREKWGIDFGYLLNMIHDSFMSSPPASW